MFSMITRAAGLPEVVENHDIQKNEFMVQLQQVMKLKYFGMSYLKPICMSFTLLHVFLNLYRYACSCDEQHLFEYPSNKQKNIFLSKLKLAQLLPFAFGSFCLSF